MTSTRRTLVADAVVLAVVMAATFLLTDGSRAWTLESARRLHALESPAAVPDVRLDSAAGGRARFSTMAVKVLLVDFVYTSCATYCSALGSVYARSEQQLAPEIAAGSVRLVSTNFDPARDDASALAAYRKHDGGSPENWELYRTDSADDLADLLTAYGIVVIPDRRGGYSHNAAIHVVGEDRKLVAILDPNNVSGAATAAREIIGGDVSLGVAR